MDKEMRKKLVRKGEFPDYFDFDEAMFNRRNDIHFKVVCIDDTHHTITNGGIYLAKWHTYGFVNYLVDTEIGHQILPSDIFIPLCNYRDYKLNLILN